MVKANRDGRTLVSAVNSKAVANAARPMSESEICAMVAEGEADIAAGHFRPAREFLKEFAKRKPGAANIKP